MRLKTQRLIALLILAIAVAFGGGAYLLQDAWKTSANLDSSNQILLTENKDLKKQLKEIPVLVQGNSSAEGEKTDDSSASASPALDQAESVTESFVEAYFTSNSTTTPTEKWDKFSPYLTQQTAEKYQPNESDDETSSSDTWQSSCELQQIYAKEKDDGAETFALVLNTMTITDEKEKTQETTQSVVAVKCHLSVVDGEWKIDQFLTANTNIGPYQFAS